MSINRRLLAIIGRRLPAARPAYEAPGYLGPLAASRNMPATPEDS
jgi:hypothetical protein